MKHTPGPWWNSFPEILKMPEQIHIAKISGTDIQEAKANAKLIANAPKMFLLLESCMDRVYGKGVENPAFGLKSNDGLSEQIEKLLLELIQ